MPTNRPSSKRDVGGQEAKTRDGKKTIPAGQAMNTPSGAKKGERK